jgi:hypothetical protein
MSVALVPGVAPCEAPVVPVVPVVLCSICSIYS